MARQAEGKDTGLGKRLAEQMRLAGYVDAEAEYGVAVQRFSFDHRIAVGLVYKWLSEESIPTRTNLIRLREILGTTPGYLLFGPELETPPKKKRRTPHPIDGGSADERPHPLPLLDDVLPLIRHWLTTGWGWLRLEAPGWSVVYTRSCAA